MRNRKFEIFGVILFGIVEILAQDVMFEDVNVCDPVHPDTAFPGSAWQHYLDSLEAHGASLHYISEEGWDALDSMDVLCLFQLWSPYPESIVLRIINFARNGGKILIWNAKEDMSAYYNNLLEHPAWRTTMRLGTDTLYYPSVYVCDFPPISYGITDSFFLTEEPMIECGENCFPFAYADRNFTIPVGAISYPFRDSGDCSSFIIAISGSGRLKYPYITDPLQERFGTNTVLTAAGVPGYELEPGAIPGGGNACELAQQEDTCTRAPNPFTPNGDSENDYCQFTFDGIGEREATIYIYDMHSILVRKIDVPSGAEAKNKSRWDGKDSSGKPVTQGLYLYVIKSDGEVICRGTITIAR